MRYLLQTALRRSNIRLIVLAIIAMILFTFASQLEIVVLGIITRKGPDFFELFAPITNGKLQNKTDVSWEALQERWQLLDSSHTGIVTSEDVINFLRKYKNPDIVEKITQQLNSILPINESLRALVFLIVIVAIFKALTLFCHRYALRSIAIRVSCDLRQTFFEHIQSLPMDFYHQYNSGSLSSRVVGDAIIIAEALNACLVNYIQTPFVVFSTLFLCFLTSWQLSLIIFLGFSLIVYPIIFLAQKVKKISKQIQKNQEVFASVLIDFLAGIQTVKIFAREEFSLKKYHTQNLRLAALEQKSAKYDLSSRPIIHTIAMFFLATALLFGLYFLEMNVSEVLIFTGLLYIFYEPIKKFAEENAHIQRGVAAAERMQDILQLQSQIQDQPDAISLENLEHSITFEDVWFRYEEQWVLKGVSFTIKKGQTVAIVGPTGSGKSTIVQLLPRLYEVQRGKICIDGQNINAYTQKSLREKIGFVPQKPFLFLDTILENITFGQSFSFAAVQKAAIQAHADEFIQRLPQKYDTELIETGKNLSGGQQQRLAIARALIKNPPILVLDEATSALDAISEYHIREALHQLKGQMTQIIIAHRLSTIEDADKIIYLDQGEKIGEGTKEELMLHCPSFKKMWEMMHYSLKLGG